MAGERGYSSDHIDDSFGKAAYCVGLHKSVPARLPTPDGRPSGWEQYWAAGSKFEKNAVCRSGTPLSNAEVLGQRAQSSSMR